MVQGRVDWVWFDHATFVDFEKFCQGELQVSAVTVSNCEGISLVFTDSGDVRLQESKREHERGQKAAE
mgnify:CR=1 FL=1